MKKNQLIAIVFITTISSTITKGYEFATAGTATAAASAATQTKDTFNIHQYINLEEFSQELSSLESRLMDQIHRAEQVIKNQILHLKEQFQQQLNQLNSDFEKRKAALITKLHQMLNITVFHNDAESLRILMRHKEHISPQSLAFALKGACKQGHAQIVRLLLENVTYAKNDLEQAFHEAERNNHHHLFTIFSNQLN